MPFYSALFHFSIPTRIYRKRLLSLDIVTDNAYKLPLSVTNLQSSDEKSRRGQVTEHALLEFKIGPWDFYRGRSPSLSLIQQSI
jgi:hypothetical protein